MGNRRLSTVLFSVKIRTGTDEEKEIYLTWLLHLIGDIHQPLHCTAVFSEQFPNGDKGGNDAFVRIRSSPVKLRRRDHLGRSRD